MRRALQVAEEEVHLAKASNEIPLDNLYVIEMAMRHFFIRAEMGKNARTALYGSRMTRALPNCARSL